MSQLFSPFVIKNVTLKNRIVMSPMCMYSCVNKDGMVNDWHIVHYTSRAIGQIGLILVEATGVTPQGRITNEDLGIWGDQHIEGLQKIVQLGHQYGAKMGIQLGHAGRKSQADGPIIAPSAIAFSEHYKVPEAMNISQITETISAFQLAASRAKKAGFDVIEIHGAHGYLINEFLSPLTNHRTDEYGGNREGRYRFLQEIIIAIRNVWDGPLFVRISANEYHPEGLTVEDHIWFIESMLEDGVDLIDVSSGGVVPNPVKAYPGYQVPYSEYIRQQVNVATSTVGLITSPFHAEEIIHNGRADLVMIGRELLRDPYWAKNAANQLSVTLDKVKQYERGW